MNHPSRYIIAGLSLSVAARVFAAETSVAAYNSSGGQTVRYLTNIKGDTSQMSFGGLQGAANVITVVDGKIYFEGATSNSYHTILGATDPTATQTYNFPNKAAGTYTLATTADVPSAQDLQSVTTVGATTNVATTFSGSSNAARVTVTQAHASATGMVVTSNGTGISVGYAGASGAGVSISDTSGGSLGLTMIKVDTDSGNKALALYSSGADNWDFYPSGQQVFEGTVDDFEITVGFTDPTADATYNWPAKSAGTYTVAMTSDTPSSVPDPIVPVDGTQNITGALTVSGKIIGQGSDIGVQGTNSSGIGVEGLVTSTSAAGVRGSATANSGTLVPFVARVIDANDGGDVGWWFQHAAPGVTTTTYTVNLPNGSGTMAVSGSGIVAVDAAGNITATEADTLATVTGRGASTTVPSTFSGNSASTMLTVTQAHASGAALAADSQGGRALAVAANGGNPVATIEDLTAGAGVVGLKITADKALAIFNGATDNWDFYANGTQVYEGTADAHETTIGFTDPTADATINWPSPSAGTYTAAVSATSPLTLNSTTGNLTIADPAGISISGNAATVTTADAGGDTTTFPMLATSATGSLAPATDADLSYNATSNALTATTFIGALNGNASTVTTNANLTGDVTSVGNATTIAANAVSNAKFRQSAGLSVVGRSANTTGDVADITGTANQVLRVSGTTLAFGAVTEAMQSLSDNTTGNVSTSAHGYVPKLTNSSVKWLADTGTMTTAPGRLISRTVKTSGTSMTYNANTNTVFVQVLGGGGGGGGADCTAGTASGAGGGGGGGSYAEQLVAVTPGATITYAIGGGGNGGTAGANNGTAGTNTTIDPVGDGASTTVTGKGGSGGIGGTATTTVGTALGGAGGLVATVGDNNSVGQAGGYGLVLALATCVSGFGGGGYNGMGGGNARNTAGAGNNAGNYGAGGGGAVATSADGTDRAGGNGSGGIIIVWEFH